jgi:hypothetical protein
MLVAAFLFLHYLGAVRSARVRLGRDHSSEKDRYVLGDADRAPTDGLAGWASVLECHLSGILRAWIPTLIVG